MSARETDTVYSFRLNRCSGETTYRHDGEALQWLDGRREGRVAFAAIRTVQVYKVRYIGSRATYWRGVDVVFFGRTCKATPIFARLARQFDCTMYGGRMIRLLGGKFAFDITEPIAAPRDVEGKIDVSATTQVITGIIEGWVREHPEQWLWLQRRWR